MTKRSGFGHVPVSLSCLLFIHPNRRLGGFGHSECPRGVGKDEALIGGTSMYKLKVFRWLERKRNVLAFDVELSTCKYRVGLAKYVSMADFIRREVAHKGPLKCLDIGSAEGRLLRYCQSQEVDFTGVDVLSRHLEEAQKAGYAHVHLCNVATESLPFENEMFDVVVCSHVLEHLENPERTVAEARRVLRPGGILIVGVPIHPWWARLVRIYVLPIFMPSKRRAKLVSEFGHVQFFTLPTLVALCSEGFDVEDVRGFYFLSAGRYLPFENWHWYYRLNTWWGRMFPNLTNEVNVVARKPPLKSESCDQAQVINECLSPIWSLRLHRPSGSLTSRFRHLGWDVGILAEPSLHSPQFGISAEAKKTKYPIRLLRYWFMHHLIHNEFLLKQRKVCVCEIGVGSGQMLQFMQAAVRARRTVPEWSNWVAVDVELQTQALKASGYTEFVQVDLENREFILPQKYDVVVLLHVLEHLHEPEAVVGRLTENLADGGIMIGGFPSHPHWFASYWEKPLRSRAQARGHVSVFSPRRVKAMAEANGLVLEFLSGAFLMRHKGLFLENFAWWTRLNLLFGSLVPSWPGEIYWLMRKPGCP